MIRETQLVSSLSSHVVGHRVPQMNVQMNSKLLSLAVCAMWLSILLLGIGTASAADNKSAVHPIAPTSLALTIPKLWTVEKNHAGTVLVARSPLAADQTDAAAQRARGVISVVVQPVKSEGPLAFAVRCRRDIERTIMGLELEKSEEILIGGRNWTKQPYRMKVGQFTFRQILYATVVNEHGVCITCSSEATSFDTWSFAFVAIIESLARSRLQIEPQ